MLFDSAVISRGSGSIGGMTASRNRGGNYLRSRTMPTNPNTPAQQQVRSILSQLTSIWSDTLTPAERAAWDLYALNVELPGPLGAPRNVGGIGMFVRSNVARLNIGDATLLRIDTAPAIFDLGDYTAPSIISATAATDTLSIGFDDTDTWANEDLAAMSIAVSRPQNPGINFFKGPYQFAEVFLGDSGVPLVSPLPVVSPFPFVAGQRVFVFVRVTRADGRLSASFRGTDLAV